MTERSTKSSRIPEQLLLDNYLSKERKSSKEPPLLELQPEKQESTQSSSNNTDKADIFQSSSSSLLRRHRESPALIPHYINYRSNLSQNLSKLIDEKQPSPIRVSPFAVDVEQIKAQLIASHIQPYSRSKDNLDSQISIITDQPRLSLDTKQKFKELIENLYVPTASAYKRKEIGTTMAQKKR